MADKKLESFKIGDKQKAGVAKSASAKAAEKKAAQPTESPTLGFRRIEKILETEAPDAIYERLLAVMAHLNELETHAKKPKEKSTIKKAKVGIERTLELMGFLFATRDQMMSPPPEKK